MSKKQKKFYVVWEGRNPGVYDSWEDCLAQIEQYPGARYKSFTSSADAAEAFRRGTSRADIREIGNLLARAGEEGTGLGTRGEGRGTSSGARDEGRGTRGSEIPEWRRHEGEIDMDAWAVDASCMGNPGVMEYRGVDLRSGDEIFRVGPFQQGTNNIGEYLAIVHAMALMEKRGEVHNIYSDSQTGMSWARKRHPNTKLTVSAETQKLYQLLARATAWLQTHNWPGRLMKWQTELWGEIPADFNRK